METSQPPSSSPTASTAPIIFDGTKHARNDEQLKHLKTLHAGLTTCLHIPPTSIAKRRQTAFIVLKSVLRAERMFGGDDHDMSPEYEKIIFTYGVRAIKAILHAICSDFSIEASSFRPQEFPSHLRRQPRPKPKTEDPKELRRWMILKQMDCYEVMDRVFEAAMLALELCTSDDDEHRVKFGAGVWPRATFFRR